MPFLFEDRDHLQCFLNFPNFNDREPRMIRIPYEIGPNVV